MVDINIANFFAINFLSNNNKRKLSLLNHSLRNSEVAMRKHQYSHQILLRAILFNSSRTLIEFGFMRSPLTILGEINRALKKQISMRIRAMDKTENLRLVDR
jgi:hypothetical protein